MSEFVIQKLVTLLGFKVDNTNQRKYDDDIKRTYKAQEVQAKNTSEKLSKIKQQQAEKDKKTAEKVYEFELKIRERLARQVEKLADKRAKQINAEFEREYNKLVQSENKKQALKEKSLQIEERARQKSENQRQRLLANNQAREEREARKREQLILREQALKEKSILRESQLREKALQYEQRIRIKMQQDQERASERANRLALKAIEDQKRASEQAKRDTITKGHAAQQAGRSIKSAGQTGVNLFGGLIGDSVETAGDIQALINQVQAFGGFKDKDKAMLSKLAKSVSMSSGMKQLDILTGIKELGKAGFQDEELKQVTKATPDFALAIDTDFQRAAKLSTDMMFSFGYSTKDLVKMQDVITTGLGKSKLDYADLSTSLKFAAGAWKQAGGTLPDLMAFLAITAQNGIKGSTAGTGGRTAAINMAMMESSSGVIDETSKRRRKATTKSLGITDAFGIDENGNEVFQYFKAMEQFAKIARKQNFSKTKITSALADMFGKPGIVANGAIFDSFYDPNKTANTTRLRNEVQGSFGNGSTSKVAAIMKKDYKFEKSQFDNSTINVQESIGKNFLPTFTNLLQTMTKFFNKISENNPVLMKVIAILALIGLGVSAVAVVIGGFLIIAGAVVVAMGVLGIGFGGLGIAFGVILGAIVLLGVAIYEFTNTGTSLFTTFFDWVANGIRSMMSSIGLGANITPYTAPASGAISKTSSFNMTNNIHNHGSNASAQKTTNQVVGSLTGMNKYFAKVSQAY